MKPSAFPSPELPASSSARKRHYRSLGARAATNIYMEMAEGYNLPAWKQSLLRMTCRKMIHYKNASNRIFHEGEVRQDGEPRQLLSKLVELGKEIRADLAVIFEGTVGPDDPLARLLGDE